MFSPPRRMRSVRLASTVSRPRSSSRPRSFVRSQPSRSTSSLPPHPPTSPPVPPSPPPPRGPPGGPPPAPPRAWRGPPRRVPIRLARVLGGRLRAGLRQSVGLQGHDARRLRPREQGRGHGAAANQRALERGRYGPVPARDRK